MCIQFYIEQDILGDNRLGTSVSISVGSSFPKIHTLCKQFHSVESQLYIHVTYWVVHPTWLPDSAQYDIHGLVQDCSNCIANALQLL